MKRQITIFYSWQSDSPPSTNRYFIEKALEKALKNLKSAGEIKVETFIERDTKNVAGSPDIVEAIFDKINNSQVFVADVSIINPESQGRRTPNPNVLFELGYAIARLGSERVICVANEQSGTVEELPFDIRQRRIAKYRLPEKRKSYWPMRTWSKTDEAGDERTIQRDALVSTLENAIRNILESSAPKAIVEGCHRSNQVALRELQKHGRYDPDRYVFRDADRQLFHIWQHAWRENRLDAGSEDNIRLIALVNDSGIGKSSLLCSFVKTVSPCLPALLLQARHIAFDSEDCIVRAVIHSLPDVFIPDASKQAGGGAAAYLARNVRFTVALDGLDEAGQPTAVQRAIRHWLHSPLGQNSLLIVSSRQEFWRKCVDRAWGAWMPNRKTTDQDVASHLEHRLDDPTQGLLLPGLFSDGELFLAWQRAGQPTTTLSELAEEVRDELRRPFTLRAYLDLLSGSDTVPPRTRTDIMSAWLDGRLQNEEDSNNRLTAGIYRDALRTVACRIEEGQHGWVEIDQLDGVPRYDPTKPPGPAVERMLHAGILELVPKYASRIRFVFEAVQDFFLGEEDVALMDRDPVSAANRLSEGLYSEVFIRLNRLGRRIVDSLRREEFLASLAETDAVRAAVVLSACPLTYSSTLRHRIIEPLKRDVTSRYRAKGAFAVQLLGSIDCEESSHALFDSLSDSSECPTHLRVVVAIAMAKLGCVEGLHFVYALPWFARDYYFEEIVAVMRRTCPTFRTALAEHATQFLSTNSGTTDHKRAVCVLSHLQHDALVCNLQEQFAHNGLLKKYENHALFASGTEAAAKLFAKSVKNAANKLSGMGYENSGLDRYEVFSSVTPRSADFRYLISTAFEVEIEGFIKDENEEVARIGIDLAESVNSPRLIYASIVAQGQRSGLRSQLLNRVGEAIDPNSWMSWWNKTMSPKIRHILLHAMSPVPSIEIEQVLIDCLDDPDYRSIAAWHLGQFGCYRAVFRLSRLLEEGLQEDRLQNWSYLEVVRAIGRLAEPQTVAILARVAQESEGDLFSFVVMSLASIRTQESERELRKLLSVSTNFDWVTSGLIFNGSPTATLQVVSEAKRPGRGPKWLAERMNHAFSWWGHTRGRYYTHIHDEPLISYLEVHETEFQGKEKWDLIRAVEQIDSENVRRLLRTLANRYGSAKDVVVREPDNFRASWPAYDELLHRGDVCAVSHFVAEAVSRDPRRMWAARELGRFPRDEVARNLRMMLANSKAEERAPVVRLLGYFGGASDLDALRSFLQNDDDQLANVAYEAFCRLSDPLLLLSRWDSL